MIKITKCPISGSTRSVKYLDLGDVPLVNNLCETKEESLAIERFPLAIQLFPASNFTCLTEIVDKGKLFETYLYYSGINKPYLAHCSRMYDYLGDFVDLQENDYVVDVGGNDGSLLKEFRKKNPNLVYVNVDGSHSFLEVNTAAGIQYVNEYFSEETDLKFKARVITSTNVFQHTEPMRSFVKGIYRNLSEDGVWCLEFPYFITTLVNFNYDQVYHEHVYYFLLQNIIDITEQEGLKVINTSFYDMHAGTLRVIIAKQSSSRQPDHTINQFLEMEKIINEDYCLDWGKRTYEKMVEYKRFLTDLVSQGKKIACFGAAGKGCVFLNSCEIDHTIIDYIIDDTPLKQGKYMPGTGIQVVSREYLDTHKVDYILILAHNFKDYIIESMRPQFNGKFLVMYPDIQVI